MAKEKLISYVKKYKYVALVVLVGVVLMLLPSGKGEQQDTVEPVNVSEGYSLAETERRMEQVLGRIRGVGQVQVMLTLKSGSSLQLAENRSDSLRDTEARQERDVVTLNQGSGYEDVVVTEQVLGRIRGVGQVQVMLTLKSGSSLQLAENRSDSLRDTEARQERDVVTLNQGSGYEDVVVTEQTYPVYQGAVIVCQGAGDSGVHLAVVQAVSVLTGLGSDKITVVQWK